jgi:hypothetical protein
MSYLKISGKKIEFAAVEFAGIQMTATLTGALAPELLRMCASQPPGAGLAPTG